MSNRAKLQNFNHKNPERVDLPSRAPKPYPDVLKHPTDYYLAPGTVDDAAFILDSWCANQAALPGPSWARVDPEIFKVEIRARVMNLLTSAKVCVARPTETLWAKAGLEPDPRELLGWACYSFDTKTQAPIVHFAYVKAHVRKTGIATAMLRHAAAVRPGRLAWATHTSPMGGPFCAKLELTFNPFLLESR